MNQNPLISVVIPAFNREKTISYCLNSVLAQTYEKIEVIVVDDCSTDNTVAVAKSYTDPRVRCIVLEKKSGAQAARNRGIREAAGDWIAFQDSDDEWMPEKIEKQVEVLSQTKFDPLVLVHCAAIRCPVNKKKEEILDRSALEGCNLYSILLFSPPPLYQTMLVSKAALEKIGYLDENVPSHQEWDTAIRLSKICNFIYVPQPLMKYYIHEDDPISHDKERDIKGRKYIIEKFEKDIKDYCGEKAWHKLLVGQLQRCLDFRLWTRFDEGFKRYLPEGRLGVRLIYLILCRIARVVPTNYGFILLKRVIIHKHNG